MSDWGKCQFRHISAGRGKQQQYHKREGGNPDLWEGGCASKNAPFVERVEREGDESGGGFCGKGGGSDYPLVVNLVVQRLFLEKLASEKMSSRLRGFGQLHQEKKGTVMGREILSVQQIHRKILQIPFSLTREPDGRLRSSQLPAGPAGTEFTERHLKMYNIIF